MKGENDSFGNSKLLATFLPLTFFRTPKKEKTRNIFNSCLFLCQNWDYSQTCVQRPPLCCDPKIVAAVDEWLLLRDDLFNKSSICNLSMVV